MDIDGFRNHLLRTHAAGLRPAVNMDTGFGPELTPIERREVLRLTAEALGPGVPFVAGAMPFGEDPDPRKGYLKSIESIVKAGGTPIVFPSPCLAGADIPALYRELAQAAPSVLGFELGPQFAPFGRIFSLETVAALMAIPNLAGIKHSSLSREAEMARLELRDRLRPEFRIYTGNDLAIDMIMYGSDYLLGLSTFDPDSFALRDRYWVAGDPRFYALNDALQAVGFAAFRDPVPAYKHSAAVYLRLDGRMADPHPHPACARRPDWEGELLAPLAAMVRKTVHPAP
jgi:dihydrodipicolinate synthase/N-acetylneuraminate lyase